MSASAEVCGVLLVGVGGQGVLTAATMLASAGHRSGLEVASGQLHGMSQRGGSVECTVIFGRSRSSFIRGRARVVLAFEQLELLRNLHRVGTGTRVFVNTARIIPPGVSPQSSEYPSLDRIVERARATGAEVEVVDGPRLMAEIGEKRALNVLMLGALAGAHALPLTADAVWEAIAERSAPRFVESNRRAFAAGRHALASPHRIEAPIAGVIPGANP